LSTILKSLKKLEQEKEARQYIGTGAGYRGPGSVRLHDAKRSWIKSTWLRRGIVATVMLGLGASSFYFYNLSKNMQDQTKQSRSSQLTAKNTVKTPQQKILSHGEERASTDAPSKPLTLNQKTIKETRPAETTESTPTTSRKIQSPSVSNSPGSETPSVERRSALSSGDGVSPKVNSAKKATPNNAPAARVPKDVVIPTPSRQQPAKPVKRTPAKAPAESYQNVSVLTDGRLQVQAIVWSRIPEDRMAVINSRVLHEGDSVDDFSLIVIRPDDVVVKEGGGMRWKVLFGRP
jgi:hypothetical protein